MSQSLDTRVVSYRFNLTSFETKDTPSLVASVNPDRDICKQVSRCRRFGGAAAEVCFTSNSCAKS